MKIVYVNGLHGEKSTKPKKLSDILNREITHIVYDYEKHQGLYIEDLFDALDKEQPDVIIASSTGAYLVREYCFTRSVALIALNPVIDIEKTFRQIEENIDIPYQYMTKYNHSISELVLVNLDDEVINPEETIQTLNNVLVFEKGGHRFSNLEETKGEIEHFLNFLV